MNGDGPMEAAIMFHVFMSAVPLACPAPESADRPDVCEGDIAGPTPPLTSAVSSTSTGKSSEGATNEMAT